MATFPDLPLPEKVGLDLEKKARELGVKYLIPSVHSLSLGILGPIVPVSAAKRLACNGCNMPGYGNFGYESNEPECYTVPDPSTFIQLPWKPDFAWLACHVYYKGKISPRCPRYHLIQQLEKLKKAGYELKTGVEPEFYLVHKDEIAPVVKTDTGFLKYQDPSVIMCHVDFVTKVLDAMDKLGWKPYQFEREAASSQYEVSFDYSDPLTTADRAHFFKFMVKDIARELGFRVSFMPMLPEFGFGNGLHVHQSLWDIESGKNVMPGNGDLGLSDTARYWLAGLLDHLEGLTALVCPSTNSYKRLHIFTNCFNFTGYGLSNRVTPLRVVESAEGDNTQCDRIEYRQPDSSVNPYFLHSVVIAAGMDGLNKQQNPNPLLRYEEDLWGKDTPKHAKVLPKTLEEAIIAMRNDKPLTSAIGDDIIEAFIKAKKFDSEEHNKEVSKAEKSLIDSY